MLTSIGTVSNLKRRYLKGGLERGIQDRPGQGTKPKIDGENHSIYHAACLYERYSPAEARRIAKKIE
jgi:transposase